MASAARSRAHTAQSNRRASARRKQRAVGAVITSVLLVAIGAVVILILANPPKYRVTPTDNSDLVRAISSIPTSDVPGMDPVARPAGTVRSYYLVRGRVTTVIYVSRQALADETKATVAQLTAGGWKAPANLPPGRVATEKDSFTGVYADRDSILQLALVRVKDITAATYILQSAT